ncbi:MAG: AI-2E family transporter [Candidatus Moranbacteria bacterium]|nr:AI-2E family transporter [Candidatus Moranbacteria bacterium]MDD3964710.1 AI-2E family transporter [Candidatus Moranbacteria bacterium]
MQLKSLNVYFFFLILLLVGVVVFFIFQPFLTAIVAAAILATLFKKPYFVLEKWTRGQKILSATLTCLLVVFVVVTPIFLILSLAIGEATGVYHTLSEGSTVEILINQTVEKAHTAPYLNIFFDTQTFNQERILNDIQKFTQNALGLLQAVYQSITGFLFWTFMMFFTLFYFLIDGKRMLGALMNFSPLKNEHDRLLIRKFISISRATLKGTLVIGLLQGFLGGLTFWIAGVPSPAIWGLVMALCSIIPMFGSGLIWLPTGIIMFFLGNIWQGVFIFAVGLGIISTIDNILRPKLVGRDTEMHPLLVLFSTLGGIALFGLSGFIIGPIIISLFLALGEIYMFEFRDQLKEYNS